MKHGLVWMALGLGACGTVAFDVEPHFEGCATDENWVTLDDYIRGGRVVRDTAQAPLWLTPGEGDGLHASDAAPFRFQPSAGLTGTTQGDARCPQFAPSSVAGVGPRHLPAVSGTLFHVSLVSPGGTPYRVLTTRQSVRVPASIWATWVDGPVTATLLRVQLLENAVVAGPFQGDSRTFTVLP